MLSDELNKLINEFADSMASIQHKQRMINRFTNREIQYLNENKEVNGEDNYDLNLLTYICPYENIQKPYKSIKTTLKEYMKTCYLHKNKQYQWLLVEAYELFEDFLEDLYALIGFHDNSFWLASQFGNIQITEIKNQNLSWFKERVSGIKGKPYSILNQLKSKLTELRKFEGQNRGNLSLFFSFVLVEKLRHIIVHKNGITGDKNEFIDIVLKKADYHNDKNNIENAKEHINFHFGSNEFENTIFLSEVPVDIPISAHINRHEILIGTLTGYAKLISDSLLKHYDPQKNFA